MYHTKIHTEIFNFIKLNFFHFKEIEKFESD